MREGKSMGGLLFETKIALRAKVHGKYFEHNTTQSKTNCLIKSPIDLKIIENVSKTEFGS